MIGGKTLVITYQEDDYFSNDSHNLALYVKDERAESKLCQLFLVSALYKSLKPKYSWGDSISYKKIQNDSFFLPTLNGEIAFSFMESCIRELEEERIRELSAYLKVCRLDDYTIVRGGAEDKALIDFRNGRIVWKEFKIGELFEKLNLKFKKSEFKKLEDISKTKTEKFNLPLVNAKDGDNGIMYYGRDSDFESAEMCIDIVNDGAVSTGNVYPQPQKTGVLYNAYLIKPKFENVTIELLIYFSQAIQKSIKLKFGYEKKASWERVQIEKILLPTLNGEIDFDFMQNFITAQEKFAIKGVIEWKDKIIDTTKDVVSI